MHSCELWHAVFHRPCSSLLPGWGIKVLSLGVKHVKTSQAYKGLLNCGNFLVKADVSMALLSSVRELEQWGLEDEPQGTRTWDVRGNGCCQ